MNINALMAQAKKVQAELEKKQEELEQKEFVVEKQGIKVVILGSKKIKSIEIDEMLVDPEDKDILEDLILIAINEGIDKITEEEDAIKPSAGSNLPF